MSWVFETFHANERIRFKQIKIPNSAILPDPDIAILLSLTSAGVPHLVLRYGQQDNDFVSRIYT